jgi:hypothetical protein
VLKSLGHQTGFATTDDRPLLAYLRVGSKVLKVQIVQDEIRFFLDYRL